MISWTRYVGYVEKSIRQKKFFKEISSTHLNYLRNHSTTRKMNGSSHIHEILDFVNKKTHCDAVFNCAIYSITNKAIKDLEEHAAKESENIDDSEKRRFYLEMAKQYNAGRAFFTLDTKEVFYVTDIDDREGLKDKQRKPSRFSNSEWRKIHIRSTIVHELFHFYIDYTTNSRNELQHERYAYTGMIDWCREKENLKDEEIANYIISTYGQRIAFSEKPGLDPKNKKDREYLERRGYEEGMKLIKERDALSSSYENELNEDH